MTFKVLSVAENEGLSDRLTAVGDQYVWSYNTRTGVHQTISFTVTSKRELIIKDSRNGIQHAMISYQDVNLESLILFLQDAKTFISEEEMVLKIKGS